MTTSAETCCLKLPGPGPRARAHIHTREKIRILGTGPWVHRSPPWNVTRVFFQCRLKGLFHVLNQATTPCLRISASRDMTHLITLPKGHVGCAGFCV